MKIKLRKPSFTEITTLEELEPGSLFLYEKTLALKTDYRNDDGSVLAYIVNNGSTFWGGCDTSEELNNLMVIRVDLKVKVKTKS